MVCMKSVPHHLLIYIYIYIHSIALKLIKMQCPAIFQFRHPKSLANVIITECQSKCDCLQRIMFFCKNYTEEDFGSLRLKRQLVNLIKII